MGVGNTGISPSYKVPRYIAKIVFAAGAVSAGSQRLRCLLVGMKTTAGIMAVDSTPIRVSSTDDIDTQAGPGSQLAVMGYAAMSIPSIECWIAAVTEPAGGTQATLTILLAGTVTAAGTLRFRIAGQYLAVNVGPTFVLDDIGAAIVALFNGKARLPVTVAYNTGTKTATLTVKNKGATGKDWTLYFDPTDAPTGITLTITGSATQNTGGYRFGAASTGTGAEDVTTLLTKLTKQRYARIACAQNDATNAALWETHVNTKSGPLSLLLDQLIFGHNGAKAAVKSLAQTTLNAWRAQVLWLRNSENHPCEIAALVAAVRSVTEQTSPVPDYDGYVLSYLQPQAFEDDYPSDSEQDEVLNAGITPLTTVDGAVRVVRAVCSYCMNNGVQDERCLDIGDVVMTDYATLDLKLMYETEFRPANPLVQDDPSPEEEPPAAGIGYPRMWNSKVSERLQLYRASGWLAKAPTGSYAPVSAFIVPGGYIGTDTPLPVARVAHRLDNVMRQISTY